MGLFGGDWSVYVRVCVKRQGREGRKEGRNQPPGPPHTTHNHNHKKSSKSIDTHTTTTTINIIEINRHTPTLTKTTKNKNQSKNRRCRTCRSRSRASSSPARSASSRRGTWGGSSRWVLRLLHVFFSLSIRSIKTLGEVIDACICLLKWVCFLFVWLIKVSESLVRLGPCVYVRTHPIPSHPSPPPTQSTHTHTSHRTPSHPSPHPKNTGLRHHHQRQRRPGPGRGRARAVRHVPHGEGHPRAVRLRRHPAPHVLRRRGPQCAGRG